MGRNDWAKLTEVDDLPGVGIAPDRRRGWRLFTGLLLVGIATFVFGYYLPLYRAHSLLRNEYKTVSTEASTFHKQLGATVATLNQAAEECDKLRVDVRARSKDTDALVSRTERIERGLQIPLKKFQGKGRLSVERKQEKLRVTLAAPAMVEPTGGELTDAGKKALCAVGGSLKDSDVDVLIQGLGVRATERRGSAWQLATVRAGNTAQHLSQSCGVESSRIEVAVSTASSGADEEAVALEITPRS